jgi:hypothetical protein
VYILYTETDVVLVNIILKVSRGIKTVFNSVKSMCKLNPTN